jgi:hypothetical protein
MGNCWGRRGGIFGLGFLAKSNLSRWGGPVSRLSANSLMTTTRHAALALIGAGNISFRVGDSQRVMSDNLGRCWGSPSKRSNRYVVRRPVAGKQAS